MTHPHTVDRARRRPLALALATLLVAVLLAGLLPTGSAWAWNCATHAGKTNFVQVLYDPGFGHPSQTFYMGSAEQKAASDCNDVNLSWVSRFSTYRGQYHDGTQWRWSNAGAAVLSSGAQSPWAVMVENVVPTTPVRIGNMHQWSTGTWQI